ncbi:MAG: VCBS repeat-containing protein [Cyclobacteriaceae bacterium]|nr:VCBS repeat-containing protein [Cyclobacteriaceae bacterium]
MGSAQHISQLFRKKLTQWENHKLQVKSDIHSGKFYRFKSGKRQSLISKLHRLTRRLNKLQWQMQLAALGGTLVALTPFDKVQAQELGPFIKKSRLENPLRTPLSGYAMKPTAIDLDNDGDYDIVSGNSDFLQVFKNVGDNTTPIFEDIGSLSDNYNYTPASLPHYKPAFADVDGDGDMDLAVATYNSGIIYYRNDGSSYTQLTGPSNPFNSISISTFPSISFIDYDGDTDFDLLVADTYSGGGRLQYFRNDGSSTFTPTAIPLPDISDGYFRRPVPIISDIDEDGFPDLTIGTRDDNIRFFEDTGGGFVEDVNPWNSANKTGNPFYGIDLNRDVSPEFVDLDGDGDLDLIAGYVQFFFQNVEAVAYFENKGDAVFERKVFLDNPFGGAATGADGVPYFVDVDEDGTLDALLGGKYGNTLTYYKNVGGVFQQELGPSSPFYNILAGLSYFTSAKPVYVDIDNDGDLDLILGDYNGNITFFLSDDDVLSKQVMDASNPFFDLGPPRNKDVYSGLYYSVHIVGNSNTAIDLVDIDNDGDLDLFSGNHEGTVDFYRNTGTATSPHFEKPLDPTENPLDKSHIPEFDNNFFDYSDTQPKFIDLDHDGDADLILGGHYYVNDSFYGDAIFYFENVGTPEAASFEMQTPALLPYTYRNPNPGLIDMDGDGDLDIFVGDDYGIFEFYLNENPAAVTTINTSVIEYQFNTGPVTVDATLTVADSDDDDIVSATVTIQNFQPGNEALSFTAQAPVTGDFDASTGVLTLTGSASVDIYQTILRTVAYSYTGPDPGARKGKTNRVKSLARSIVFRAFDSDLTSPVSATRSLNIIGTAVNQPPSLNSITLSTVIQGSASIDLAPLISDSEGNFDPTADGAITIIAQPQSGAVASISGSVLTVNYSGLSFSGNESLQIRACDLAGGCTDVIVNVSVIGEVVVYNGISPNGDEFNQFFNIENIEILGPENKVSIFNRWGDRIFEMDNYNNDDRRFEGLSDGGKELPSGVYFYKIEFTNGLPELQGYLTLKR